VAVNASYASGSYIQKKYTILMAGAVSGTFDSMVNANGLSHNQNNVGDTIIDYFNMIGAIPLAFGGLTTVGLTALSGEFAVIATQSSNDVQSEFLNAMLNPALAVRDNTTGMAADASHTDGNIKSAELRSNPWHVWSGVYGGRRSTDGSSSVGSSDTTGHNYGVAAGVDYAFSSRLLVGVAVSAGNGVANNAGSGRSDIYQIGVYAHRDISLAGYITGSVALTPKTSPRTARWARVV
jgi:hypothetical protein